MSKKEKEIYLGLDIGTDSVGYAVTDTKYNLVKFHGEPAWGATIFDEGSLCDQRRNFRVARRRLDRRQQRILLLQELFAKAISEVDERFFVRISESALYRNEVEDDYSLFNDSTYTDRDYYKEYPTIHHLIVKLMNSEDVHDVRLVYLACAWLIAHRGHFLSSISLDNIASVKDFDVVYDTLISYFIDNGYDIPWNTPDVTRISEILKKKVGVNNKERELIDALFAGKKPSKDGTEGFPFSRAGIVKLLAGGKVQLKDLYQKEEYTDLGSVDLAMDDEKLDEIMANIGDDYDLIAVLRSIYDWSLLVDILGECSSISEAKVGVYEQHKRDLSLLKKIVKKYIPGKYDEIFRNKGKDNYVAYSYHIDGGDTSSVKKKGKAEFSKYLIGILKTVKPDCEDEEDFEDMMQRLQFCTFLPKQKNTDNRVIPYQLYQYELHLILKNASIYCDFLNEEDSTGLSVREKIESIFTFRIPYFVGPLNAHSKHAWIQRKAGKIYPWTFEEMVDLDASEQRFIDKLTNHCTYLPSETVLPKDSLLYHRYTVLNELNNLRIYGVKIDVGVKQAIYNELFMNVKKVTRKKLMDYLVCNGVIRKGEEDSVTGIDININSNLSSHIAFKKMLADKILLEKDIERIIERASYAEDKTRLARWLKKEYPDLSSEDQRYICKLKIKDFGRLSKKFLIGLSGTKKETGEIFSIIEALWNTQDNLMELLSDRYTFADEVDEYRKNYYAEHPHTLDERLDEMYVPNSVRRSVYRTLAIVKDVEKAFGTPTKIFVETTRGASLEQKGKRTLTRKQQILNLYQKCQEEDVRILKKQLEAMGEYADSRLQGDKLFLYYMQLGKCMYSGAPISLESLGTKAYDIDHIYPQAYVKDDSIINNKVLVLSTENGKKSDKYPIASDVRRKMAGYWDFLMHQGLISEEKYKRLTRNTAFSDEEKMGFISRQLTVTSQSTKAIAAILKDRYPDAEIVYSKARLVSEFRQEFDIIKSRLYNDLHHAIDAYLNIVVGNVYDMRFSKRWFHINNTYSIKVKTIFTHPLICNGMVVWDGQDMLQKVITTARKNTAHFTKYAYFKTGGLFDQLPVSKADGLVPRKKDLLTEKYGGYNKSAVMFYIPVKYKVGKKTDIIVMSVEKMYGDRFLANKEFAFEYSYVRLQHITGKKMDDVSFPLGMRPWKVNTMLSLDGFRVCIAGIGSGGKCLVAQPIMQFSAGYYWQRYLKRLERFAEKNSENVNYVYDEAMDKVSVDKNIELYDLYVSKYQHTIYKKRVNPPTETLENGRKVFEELTIQEQARALLNIHQTFGRLSGGCDLTLIHGKGKAAATVNFSSTISNWKKKYSDVRIIDASVSGLWEHESENNLLELV